MVVYRCMALCRIPPIIPPPLDRGGAFNFFHLVVGPLFQQPVLSLPSRNVDETATTVVRTSTLVELARPERIHRHSSSFCPRTIGYSKMDDKTSNPRRDKNLARLHKRQQRKQRATRRLFMEAAGTASALGWRHHYRRRNFESVSGGG